MDIALLRACIIFFIREKRVVLLSHYLVFIFRLREVHLDLLNGLDFLDLLHGSDSLGLQSSLGLIALQGTICRGGPFPHAFLTLSTRRLCASNILHLYEIDIRSNFYRITKC